MTDTIYLSRAFVEFGPFKKREVLDFIERGIITSTDFLSDDGSDWKPLSVWQNGPETAKVSKPRTKAPTKKKKVAA